MVHQNRHALWCNWCEPIMRNHTNVFNAIGKADLGRLVSASRSISHVFDQLQLRKSGASFRIFRRAMQEMEIDTSHFVTHGDVSAYLKTITRSLEEVFAEGSKVCNTTLRNKIIKHQLLPYRCAKCSNHGAWEGQPLVLQVDHENGKRTDNRLENLRFLCPNCHSQTETFCGRKTKITPHCPECGKAYRGAGRRCRRCSRKLVKSVCTIQWPSNEEMQKAVWSKPLVFVASDLKCSGSALRKHCKRNSIICPPFGYWERKRRGYSHEQSLLSQKRIRPKAKRISNEEVQKAKTRIQEGISLRGAAKEIGCSHQTLLIRLKGDPVLLLTTHGNAKHMKAILIK